MWRFYRCDNWYSVSIGTIHYFQQWTLNVNGWEPNACTQMFISTQNRLLDKGVKSSNRFNLEISKRNWFQWNELLAYSWNKPNSTARHSMKQRHSHSHINHQPLNEFNFNLQYFCFNILSMRQLIFFIDCRI